jgi:leucine-rich repeat protein SHOC2
MWREFYSIEDALENPSEVDILHLESIGDSLTPLIGTFTNLKWLTVLSGDLKFLPDEIKDLHELSSLRLENCRFESIPPQIFDLNLSEVSFAGNAIETIPTRMFDLKLSSLSLARNYIDTIPHDLSKMTSLWSLNLNGNRISNVPRGGITNPELFILKLDSNRITIFNLYRRDVPKLGELYLQGNLLSDSTKDWIRREFLGRKIQL